MTRIGAGRERRKAREEDGGVAWRNLPRENMRRLYLRYMALLDANGLHSPCASACEKERMFKHYWPHSSANN